MSEERIHKILHELRVELGRTEALSEKDRSVLTDVVDQIRDALRNTEVSDTSGSSLLKTVDDAALHFEAEHPRLTQTLFQISEVLRSAGLS